MYCTIEDVRARISEAEFGGELDDTALTSAVQGASDLVSGFVATYLPFSATPLLVKELTLKVAVYNLFYKANYAATPEIVLEDYKQALRILEKIAKGEIALVSNKPTATSSFSPSARSTHTRTDMEGY